MQQFIFLEGRLETETVEKIATAAFVARPPVPSGYDCLSLIPRDVYRININLGALKFISWGFKGSSDADYYLVCKRRDSPSARNARMVLQRPVSMAGNEDFVVFGFNDDHASLPHSSRRSLLKGNLALIKNPDRERRVSRSHWVTWYVRFWNQTTPTDAQLELLLTWSQHRPAYFVSVERNIVVLTGTPATRDRYMADLIDIASVVDAPLEMERRY